MKVGIFVPLIPDDNSVPVLGPLYLLAVAKKAGHEVWLFDERHNPAALGQMIDFMPDVAGFSAVTPGVNRAMEAAGALKAKHPKTITVFGGPHPTALSGQVALAPEVDYVLAGESEKSFVKLLERIDAGCADKSGLCDVDNLVYEIGGEVVANAHTGYLSSGELEDLPWPAFDRMDMEAYFSGPQSHGLYKQGARVLPVMSTRGCPFGCTFCCRVMGKKMRSRSVGQVMEEIGYLVETYKVDEIYFEDDNFTALRSRALDILGRMASFRPKTHFRFANGVRADLVNREILQAMKEAGVYSLSFGIESGSVNTLSGMNKGLELEKARENVLLAKSMGFLVGSNCIIGYPGETMEDINESLDFFLGLPLDSMAIVNLVPFPGTAVREVCEREGYLTEAAGNWDNYYFSINNPIPLIDTPQLSSEQLVKAVRSAYRRMYMRPSWALKAMRRLSVRQIARGDALMLAPGKMKRG